MGNRHNRRRTRFTSRVVREEALAGEDLALGCEDDMCLRDKLFSFQARARLERTQHEHWIAERLEQERTRMFGGELGDEVSLCEPMLQVVLSLFDGHLDYLDPDADP